MSRCIGPHGSPKRTSEPPMRELQAIVSHLVWAKWRACNLRVLSEALGDMTKSMVAEAQISVPG